jgi:hypothetical protein
MLARDTAVTTPSIEHPCPGCGFLMYGPEAYGSYGICPLCNWEDDPVQLANPASPGGANGESLLAYQARALERWPVSIREVQVDGKQYRRDPAWRPVTKEEAEFFFSRDDANAIFAVEECYWMKPPLARGGAAAL